ncbi:3-deoxy-manno-octulosonate cytidylyltransferase [Vibrio alginolyticus]|uniref:3-deoxy-manno-octulosonate cytidylyltransferase n=1 Tax=Vibrio alginolyticus TaxID=663 RepID=UPI0012AD78DC|nr:3-deoxy-manno-octulosonate cytidylyltransferase [Vibrio alginolyticus]MCS0149128.1 3-deoxy-manno-octulosonate cytidylyltransferase [Vibrio alginolyticus]
MSNIHIVIPARFGSSRLPGKLMLDLVGKPVIAHVVERALTLTDSVYVATDNQDIFDVVSHAGATAVMTSEKHNSGTDRLAEAANKLNFADDDIVVNLQGDEPLMPIALLRQVSALLDAHSNAGIATLMQRIKHVKDFINPNVVKVAQGERCKALYFSRAPIPYPRDEFSTEIAELPQGDYFRHIGLYAYRVKTLKAITQLTEHPLESLEKLEQLRPLAHGVEIVIDEASEEPEHGIDTLEDLERVRHVILAK